MRRTCPALREASCRDTQLDDLRNSVGACRTLLNRKGWRQIHRTSGAFPLACDHAKIAWVHQRFENRYFDRSVGRLTTIHKGPLRRWLPRVQLSLFPSGKVLFTPMARSVWAAIRLNCAFQSISRKNLDLRQAFTKALSSSGTSSK